MVNMNGVALQSMTYNGASVKNWTHDGVLVYTSELKVWENLAFSKTNATGGEYSITKETVQDLTNYGLIDISVDVTFTGDFRGTNDFVSLFVDDTEYVLLAYGDQNTPYNLAKTIDVSEIKGNHTIKLWVRGSSASSTFPGSFSGTTNLTLKN